MWTATCASNIVTTCHNKATDVTTIQHYSTIFVLNIKVVDVLLDEVKLRCHFHRLRLRRQVEREQNESLWHDSGLEMTVYIYIYIYIYINKYNIYCNRSKFRN